MLREPTAAMLHQRTLMVEYAPNIWNSMLILARQQMMVFFQRCMNLLNCIVVLY